jgi:hypothetical protein
VAALHFPVAYTHQDDDAVDAQPGVVVTGSWLTP